MNRHNPESDEIESYSIDLELDDKLDRDALRGDIDK